MTEGQWEALNGLETNVGIAAENERRELEETIDTNDQGHEETVSDCKIGQLFKKNEYG